MILFKFLRLQEENQESAGVSEEEGLLARSVEEAGVATQGEEEGEVLVGAAVSSDKMEWK